MKKPDGGLGLTREGYSIFDIFPEYNPEYESFYGEDIERGYSQQKEEEKKVVVEEGQMRLV